ncbi:MAG TPA: alpha-N-acetylglucosaminidase TIM-barrel domain-containing protein [Opitutaceae bacterium]|jgi:alpha-N-acetylglucosaminidase|nr:alpha-N-acetylglucosaminidase TIM-barrel domain-containing protein [Opitutaceae bacterium]
MLRCFRPFGLLFLSLVVVAPSAIADAYPGAEGIVARRVPWLAGHIRFDRLPSSGFDAFEIAAGHPGVVVRATSANAAAAGLGWYLKYCCHRSMSHLGDNLGPVSPVPVPGAPIRIESWAVYRYALNYCTFNYAMSFYSWADWEHELDWMALSGVNLMLVANGEEAVWAAVMRRLGLSERDIAAFLPGPTYTAWWLMGNLEGAGGPMSAGMIARRAGLQRRMIGRMRELGIQPLMPGFYGMIPAALARRLHAHVVDQGLWDGFQRPAILDPTDPEFPRVAGIYYEELKRLYGADFRFFSGDPFHEGGVMAGVDLGKAGVAVQAAMRAHFPGAVWVLQGWLENPRKELIASTDKSHVLVQELFGENTNNWEKRGAYEGTPFVWCCIDNFGERPGLFGPLRRFCDEVYRARTGPYGRYLKGTGIMPEGIDNNPAAYDLVLELAWHREHVDPAAWLAGYEAYRYGAPDPDIAAAWKGLLATAYNSKAGGAPEDVLCARPALPPQPVTHWGGLGISYDQARFAAAVRRFAAAAPRFSANAPYRLDLITFRLQVLSNEALGVAQAATAACMQRNREAFRAASARLLQLGGEADDLLSKTPRFRLDAYEQRALAYGQTPAERHECLRDGLALITYWAGNDRSHDDSNDYAFKAWSGMMDSYSMGRWRAYFKALPPPWTNPAAPLPDFFTWERAWVAAQVSANYR